MDRTLPDPQMIADHLAQAERHVADAQEQVQRQREVIAKLKRDGHDARLAG
jgi:F0F1-type ATP synthase membrane subunit b/b'